MEYIFTTWKDYWNLFDQLIALLTMDNQTGLAKSFKESQLYVNGLTDGWYEFKFAFEKTFETNKNKMNKEQIVIAELLLAGINKSLKR